MTNCGDQPTPTLYSEYPVRRDFVEARVVVVNDSEALTDHVTAWESLAAAAQEPNVFYEPWMFMPALTEYGRRRRLQFVLIYAHDRSEPPGPPALCGFFPLERRLGFKGVPVSVLGLWRHLHCFFGGPLIRAGAAALCFDALFDWVAAGPHIGTLMEFPWVASEGPIAQALASCLQARLLKSFELEKFTRAFMKRGCSGQAYMAAALSPSRRKKLNKQRKQLGQLGRLNCLTLQAHDDVAAWIESFLSLEATGWKGKQGTALACKEPDRRFFEQIALEAFRRGRLRMLALHLDGRPIAQICDFIGGDGVFSFKIAYDEAFADFSPGILLDLESIRHFHDEECLAWVDSCNAPGPSVLTSLWTESRAMQTLIVSTGSRTGNLLIALAPKLRKLRRAMRFAFPASAH
ncbi:MAG TPA: GNAT family N-acetyltransferase [Gemmataceae bacterium]|nr:GNAT family N-acetyltransferase [Gemmataceae bacterium]